MASLQADEITLGSGRSQSRCHSGNTCGSCRLLTATLSPFHKLPETHGRGGQCTMVAMATADFASTVYLDTFVIVQVRAEHIEADWTWGDLLYALIF